METATKKEQVAILTSDKLDLTKIVTKDKKGHFIMTKGQFIKRT